MPVLVSVSGSARIAVACGCALPVAAGLADAAASCATASDAQRHMIADRSGKTERMPQSCGPHEMAQAGIPRSGGAGRIPTLSLRHANGPERRLTRLACQRRIESFHAQEVSSPLGCSLQIRPSMTVSHAKPSATRRSQAVLRCTRGALDRQRKPNNPGCHVSQDG